MIKVVQIVDLSNGIFFFHHKFVMKKTKVNPIFINKFAPMLIEVFKSKIHRVRVTESDLDYIGSITVDEDLLDAAGIMVGERVYIVNVNNGERFDTYTIRGKRGSGEVCLNGPAARKVQKGDVIIIIAYAQMTPEEAKSFQPKIVFPNEETNLLT